MRNAVPEPILDCSLQPVKIHVAHAQNCEFTNKLFIRLKEEIPGAKVTTEVSQEEGVFEFFVNDKIVYSKKLLKEFPNLEEMVEIAYWCNKGKTFMHMYLCTVAEGGEPNMVIHDRKNTPLARRIMLSCVIS